VVGENLNKGILELHLMSLLIIECLDFLI